MRTLITWLVLLAVSSMLVGTGWAGTTAWSKMPCCPDNTNPVKGCHHFCAPSPFAASALAPVSSTDAQAHMSGAGNAGEPPLLVGFHKPPTSVKFPSGRLFKRIHVFLI